MLIDYCPEYFKIDSHNGVEKDHLLYMAVFDKRQRPETHVVQIIGIRQEYNPFYLSGKGPKYYEPEYNVALVSYQYKSVFHRVFDKKTLVQKEDFWIPHSFLRETELEAKAALLSYVKDEKTNYAKSVFEIDNPGYLEGFQSKEEIKTRFRTHDFIRHFEELAEEEAQTQTQKSIFEKIPLEA